MARTKALPLKPLEQPLSEVLERLVLEEAEPTRETLARWVIRYPRHARGIWRFVTTWAIQQRLPASVSVDEERIANHLAGYAIELMRRQDASQGDPEPVL